MKFLALLVALMTPVLASAHEGHASYGTLFHEYEHAGGLLIVILAVGVWFAHRTFSRK